MNRFNGSAVYESAFAWLGRYEARLRNTEDQLRFQARQAEKTKAGENAMILRIWKGQKCAQKAGKYPQHRKQRVFPKLRNVEGCSEAYLLPYPINAGVEFVVLSLWDSMPAVHGFAGDDPIRGPGRPRRDRSGAGSMICDGR